MPDLPRVHVHLTVSDLTKSQEFYERLFGVAPVKVKPGYVKFLPTLGPLNLALSEARGAESRGHVDHMGIQVDAPEIVVRELERVKAAGLPVREEFRVECCHANQDKFWVSDPDGVEWEIYVLNHDLDDGVPGATAAQPSLTTGLTLSARRGGGCCSAS